MRFSYRSLLPLLCTSLATGTLAIGTSAQAAEKIVLKYGFLQQSVPVADLTTFAETGDRAVLESYGVSGDESQKIRNTLTQQIPIDVRTIDQGLNNPIGDAVLDKVGEAIQPPTGGASRQSLRAALVLSASDDGKVSLLEVIQKYPTSEVHVDVAKLAKAYSQVAAIEGQVRKVMGVIDIFRK